MSWAVFRRTDCILYLYFIVNYVTMPPMSPWKWRDKNKILLHLSIFYEDQQFFQHRICFSIQPPDYSDPWPRLARSTSFSTQQCINFVYISFFDSSFSRCQSNYFVYCALDGHLRTNGYNKHAFTPDWLHSYGTCRTKMVTT
jgi:hypothetical protein